MQKYDLMIADPICSMLIALLIGVRWVCYYKPWPLSTRLETILHPQTPPRNPQQHLTQIIQKPLHSALHQEPCEAVGAPAGWITGYTLRGWRPEHFLNMWRSQKTQHVTLSCGIFQTTPVEKEKCIAFHHFLNLSILLKIPSDAFMVMNMLYFVCDVGKCM